MAIDNLGIFNSQLNLTLQFSSVQFSHSEMSDSLRPHESQHARPPCPSPTPGVYSNSCPSSRWCHPTECLMSYGWRFVTLCRRQGSRPSPWKRNAKKAKWLSEEALQISVKRREVKSKGEKERYSHLNAEFQRIARRDKKAFLSDQCKEIEENNRMGKTRDLFKYIRDTMEHFIQRWTW